MNVFLNIDRKNIGDPIILKIIVKSERVEEFRDTFNLDEKEYDDNKLLSILKENKYNFDNAFASLFY